MTTLQVALDKNLKVIPDALCYDIRHSLWLTVLANYSNASSLYRFVANEIIGNRIHTNTIPIIIKLRQYDRLKNPPAKIH